MLQSIAKVGTYTWSLQAKPCSDRAMNLGSEFIPHTRAPEVIDP